jgi:plasmid stabilization system protein ParE
MDSQFLQFHPVAIAEANAAVQWYRERNFRAAEAFLSEIDRVLEMIVNTPEMWPHYIGNTRRALLRHFPFSVVYRQISDRIEVIAIAHGWRRPRYWMNRLS